jgi:hypothetical protein
MYCGGEPVMGSDPTGHFNPSKWLGNIQRFLTTGARNQPGLPSAGRLSSTPSLTTNALASTPSTPPPPYRSTESLRGPAPPSYFESEAALRSPTHVLVPTPHSSTPPPPLPPRRIPRQPPTSELQSWENYFGARANNPQSSSSRRSSPKPAVSASNAGRSGNRAPTHPPATWRVVIDSRGRERVNLNPMAPAVPDRLLGDLTMRRADGSTYRNLDAAIEQLRGGKLS